MFEKIKLIIRNKIRLGYFFICRKFFSSQTKFFLLKISLLADLISFLDSEEWQYILKIDFLERECIIREFSQHFKPYLYKFSLKDELVTLYE